MYILFLCFLLINYHNVNTVSATIFLILLDLTLAQSVVKTCIKQSSNFNSIMEVHMRTLFRRMNYIAGKQLLLLLVTWKFCKTCL